MTEIKSATYTATGFGILVLDATNITCYGNLVVNCQVGIGFGNKAAGQSSNIYNNTFANCAQHGVYMVGGADNTSNLVRNNIFTGNGLAAVQVDSAAWTGESNNCFYGFSAPVAHSLATSTITSDPDLSYGKPSSTSPILGAGTYLGGTDFYGKEIPSPAPIGAICHQPARGTSGRSISTKRAAVG